MKCQGDNPFASNMMQYLYGLNEKFVPEIDGATLDIITNLLISTKNISRPKPQNKELLQSWFGYKYQN